MMTVSFHVEKYSGASLSPDFSTNDSWALSLCACFSFCGSIYAVHGVCVVVFMLFVTYIR